MSLLRKTFKKQINFNPQTETAINRHLTSKYFVKLICIEKWVLLSQMLSRNFCKMSWMQWNSAIFNLWIMDKFIVFLDRLPYIYNDISSVTISQPFSSNKSRFLYENFPANSRIKIVDAWSCIRSFLKRTNYFYLIRSDLWLLLTNSFFAKM